VLHERGRGPSSGRFIVGECVPVHPRFAFGFTGRSPGVSKAAVGAQAQPEIQLIY
jgi:hypothetical protein